MKGALIAFGTFALLLGACAALMAFRDGAIADHLGVVSSRQRNPLLFWSAIAGFGLIATSGTLALIVGLFG
jgi:hypothetical protein